MNTTPEVHRIVFTGASDETREKIMTRVSGYLELVMTMEVVIVPNTERLLRRSGVKSHFHKRLVHFQSDMEAKFLYYTVDSTNEVIMLHDRAIPDIGRSINGTFDATLGVYGKTLSKVHESYDLVINLDNLVHAVWQGHQNISPAAGVNPVEIFKVILGYLDFSADEIEEKVKLLIV